MLVGGAGCGKTAVVMGRLRTLSDEYMHTVLNINYFTNANSLQRILEAPLEKKVRYLVITPREEGGQEPPTPSPSPSPSPSPNPSPNPNPNPTPSPNPNQAARCHWDGMADTAAARTQAQWLP